MAAEEINYRRFFDINDLAAIRMEMPEVFGATHRALFRLLAEGKVTGLRIDHPDGLWDPADYFRQLQEELRRRLRSRQRLDARPAPSSSTQEVRSLVRDRRASGLARGGARAWPLYVVGGEDPHEGEALPRDWAVDGTTGYDFLNAGQRPVRRRATRPRRSTRSTRRSPAMPTTSASLVNAAKKMIMLMSLASEINALGHQLDRISERNRRYRDFTLNSLTFAIREVIACLPVYRTYITGAGSGRRSATARSSRQAVAEAKRRNPRTAESDLRLRARHAAAARASHDFRRGGPAAAARVGA